MSRTAGAYSLSRLQLGVHCYYRSYKRQAMVLYSVQCQVYDASADTNIFKTIHTTMLSLLVSDPIAVKVQTI